MNDNFSEFRAGITQVNNYIAIAYKTAEDGSEICTPDEKEFIISSAFLKMFIYWEGFIEKAFIIYLTGGSSTTGDMLTKYANPSDEEHAHKMIIGTQKYVDWANHEIVMRLSRLYFENGSPIVSILTSITTELSDLKNIRNASAHISSTTQTKLDAIASRMLGTTVTNTTVDQFIMQPHPEDVSITILQHYQNILDIAAENIASNQQ
ncbi:hypothetical protein Shal_3268 [Shewanella halifaxensis HAW-EB4]|uniref:RiboL-PSP-HEPN domain-containing protein n=1 Tax=Shewanella halifaxensis (strain HAW-EB4) TaxID=458817 RepID=B0TRQ3_SHEHH|nr:hypothetical protein [Shewanella halifaxensis]ABZ77815.1 hypothetical protein Shal_3268 [Shewanella halifaxensis HAW-EB4]